MDVQTILAINMMAMSAMLAGLAVVHRQPGALSWAATNVLVVLVGAAALKWLPALSGWIVAAVFVPLVAAPFFLTFGAVRARQAGRHGLANTLARWVMILHPSRAVRFQFAIDQAVALKDRSATIAALSALAADARTDEKPVVDALLAWEADDWETVLSVLRASPKSGALIRSPLEIRALGELGRIDEMAQAFEASRFSFQRDQQPTAALFLNAFTGRVEPVRALFEGPLKGLDQEAKTHWLAVARLKASPTDHAARDDLARLSASAQRERSRRAAARHLSSPGREAPAISAQTARIIATAMERPRRVPATSVTVPGEQKPRSEPTIMPTAAPARLTGAPRRVTLALILANILYFLVSEFDGGAEDIDTLVRLGAMWQPYVTGRGQWWRLLSATFLHFGPLHLGMNMLFLYVVGRNVEAVEGSFRLLLLYLNAALFSTLIVCGLMWAGLIEKAVLVGASGALFGLFGIEAVKIIAKWWRTRDAEDRGQVLTLAMLLAIQLAVDLSIPNVSIAAHVSGFAVGLILGLLVHWFPPAPKRPDTTPPLEESPTS